MVTNKEKLNFARRVKDCGGCIDVDPNSWENEMQENYRVDIQNGIDPTLKAMCETEYHKN